jgi:hypothetical protein
VFVVSILRRPAPAEPVAQAELPTCDPCGVHGVPMETRALEGVDVLLCVDFRACISRAKQTGVWKP